MKHWSSYPEAHITITRLFAGGRKEPLTLKFDHMRHAQSARATFYKLITSLGIFKDLEPEAMYLYQTARGLQFSIQKEPPKFLLIIEHRPLNIGVLTEAILENNHVQKTRPN